MGKLEIIKRIGKLTRPGRIGKLTRPPKIGKLTHPGKTGRLTTPLSLRESEIQNVKCKLKNEKCLKEKI